MELTSASLVVMARSLNMVISFTVEAVTLSQCPSLFKVIGGAFILLAIALLTSEEFMKRITKVEPQPGKKGCGTP